MPRTDDIASLDQMRDLDEEEGDEGLDETRNYRFDVSSTFNIRGLDAESAFETLVRDHLEDEDDPALEKRDIELIDEE